MGHEPAVVAFSLDSWTAPGVDAASGTGWGVWIGRAQNPNAEDGLSRGGSAAEAADASRPVDSSASSALHSAYISQV